jgi:hypothetical protein
MLDDTLGDDSIHECSPPEQGDACDRPPHNRRLDMAYWGRSPLPDRRARAEQLVGELDSETSDELTETAPVLFSNYARSVECNRA